MPSARRRLADLACRLLARALPSDARGWAQAIRCETASIADDVAALRFALGSLVAIAPRTLLRSLLKPQVDHADSPSILSGASHAMRSDASPRHSPRSVGIACLIGAVALGLAYLAAAGAPVRILGINAASLLLGLAMLACAGRAPFFRAAPAGLPLVCAGALLVTALLGRPVEGAARWVSLGGLALQPSLILLPPMILGYAQARGRIAAAALIVAAVALAMQPDRAMAAMLAAAIGVLLLRGRDRVTLVAFVASLIGVVATALQPDTLPAMPWVDGVFHSAFAVHPLAGVAVWGGAVLMLVPALLMWRHEPHRRDQAIAFGTVWLVAIAAAAFGNYPTPLVGYGGSAILGYAIGLIVLPRRPLANSATPAAPSGRREDQSTGRTLRSRFA